MPPGRATPTPTYCARAADGDATATSAANNVHERRRRGIGESFQMAGRSAASLTAVPVGAGGKPPEAKPGGRRNRYRRSPRWRSLANGCHGTGSENGPFDLVNGAVERRRAGRESDDGKLGHPVWIDIGRR